LTAFLEPLRQRATFGTTGRLRMPAKIVARQIDLICALKLMSATAALAAPNGGYLKSPVHNSW